jgi:hypothetical protein
MFNWFNARRATEFGEQLAVFFADRVPAASIPATDKKPLRHALEVIQKMHRQLAEFRASEKLNVYKKAKLANTFQWKLIELGYDKRIVQELTKELLLHTV